VTEIALRCHSFHVCDAGRTSLPFTASACALNRASSRSSCTPARAVRVQVEMMGSQPCEIVGKSQPVLTIINPIILTRLRMSMGFRVGLGGGARGCVVCGGKGGRAAAWGGVGWGGVGRPTLGAGAPSPLGGRFIA
jgi:hypothetical protein